MPSFNDLYNGSSKGTTGTSNGVSFNDFWGLSDKEIAKRKKEQARQNYIALTQQKAAEANAEVAKNTVGNESLVSQVRRFGPGVVKEKAGAVISAATGAFTDLKNEAVNKVKYFAGPTASQRGYGTVEERSKTQEKAKELPDNLKQKAMRIQPSDGLQLLKMVKEGKSNQEINEFLDKSIKAKTAADKKAFGTAAEIASLGTGGAGVGKAFIKGGVKAAAGDLLLTTASGGVGSAGNTLRTNPEASLFEVLKSAGVGSVMGLGFGAAGAGVGALLKKSKANRAVTNAIIDESRLLPEHATPGANVITNESRLLEPGAVNPNLAVRVSSPANPSLLGQLDAVEQKIYKAQQGKAITAQEARDLMQERQAILQQIQSGGGSPELRQAVEAGRVVTNTSQTSLRHDVNGVFTPRLAQRTEDRAVANGLAGEEGFYNKPNAERMDLDLQAIGANDLVRQDPATAMNVAMGAAPAPGDLRVGAVYKAVEAAAAKRGDADTLRLLATESTVPTRATAAGQEIASLAIKDPESPVDIMRQINAIRGKSANPNISKFVTPAEAEQLTAMAQDVAQKKEVWIAKLESAAKDEKGNYVDVSALMSDASRFEYGRARVALDNYAEALQGPALRRTGRQVIKEEGYAKAAGTAIKSVAGSAKAMRATFDNSAIGRQGIKILFTHPTVWARNSLKSFSDLVRQFGGKPVLDELKADIISRPNSLNGIYKQMGADVFNTIEEAYPQHLPEQIWGIRRVVKSSDAAYTGFVQRSRADLADMYVGIARKTGVDLADKAQATSIGKMVNALTGRGYLSKEHGITNNVFFSPKLLKSHIDVLTAHSLQHGATPFVKKEAAKNLIKIIGGIGLALKIADAVRPGSVEWDPRSSNFGKVQVGHTRFDLTGGISSVAVLASRLVSGAGEVVGVNKSGSVKSSITGDITSLKNPGRLGQNAEDLVVQFFENKLAPVPATIKDYLKGEDFTGENTRTAGYIAEHLFVPLSITNYKELKNDPKSANKLIGTVADALGISTNTYSGKEADWRTADTKEITQFRQSVPEHILLEANDKYNKRYSDWLNAMESNDRYQKLSADDRNKVRQNKQGEFRGQILGAYGFKYKREASNPALKGF